MLVVRPAEIEDIDPLFSMIQDAELGLSTLKISKDRLTERIEDSARAFDKENARPRGQPYVFVMEDTTQAKVVGTSAIYSKVGGFQPFYTYEIKSVIKKSEDLGVAKEIHYLDLQTTHSGPTEIGSLFLSREYQGKGNGRLLSLARFLFAAQFLERFEAETIAELRGIVHENGHSPLWDAVGSHFFQMEYPRAETQTIENKKFIAELMPQHPIYVPLLPEDAQEVLGQVHRRTIPAKIMLEQEGFEYRNFVDIFDGGPTVHCATASIRTIRESKILKISDIQSEIPGDRFLVSNRSLKFRATQGTLAIEGENVVISQAMAARLNVEIGDTIRAVKPTHRNRTQQ
ncbi:MAG: arginine N-succinyltransferase [Planctomycetaceae bacterium]|nr:arginine N-succinyltransferase [Planctomycetaceae bacterium]MCP4463431.1 arginine N-succinyltransferase [Planctomycetaceae bacterium]MDG1808772.1 arginine N-succinyltransferase [Pirellulaceae bacterium]MDG2102828.1 arginine N-succinyltransferase [Pirellulaceae bacterium]